MRRRCVFWGLVRGDSSSIYDNLIVVFVYFVLFCSVLFGFVLFCFVCFSNCQELTRQARDLIVAGATPATALVSEALGTEDEDDVVSV